ncbi:MAG TPA: nuclear transport factor 2 family protein [Pseudomonadales bacterium]|nr:nuclear transport factor 2 family protein [Pseudomonadales bacterium]
MSLTEKSRAAALAYVECINTKNLERLLALFADNGRLVHPYGLFEGKDKLAEFYGGLVMLADTQLSVGRVAAEGKVATAEVTGVSPQAPDKPQYAIDLFEVNDAGKIVELAIYYRNFDLK